MFDEHNAARYRWPDVDHPSQADPKHEDHEGVQGVKDPSQGIQLLRRKF
jgi:hypothetical protein